MQVDTHVVGSDLNMNAPNKSKTWDAVIWGLCLAAGTFFVEQQIETYVKTHDGPFGYLTWDALSSDERKIIQDLAPERYRYSTAKAWWGGVTGGTLKYDEKGAIWTKV